MTAIATVQQEPTKAGWPSYLALAAGGALLLKATLIIGADGDANDTLTGGLYLGGLLLALVAAVGTGMAARRGRRTATAVGLVLLLVAYVLFLSDAVGMLVELVNDEAYVTDEAPIGLLGAALLAVGVRTRR